MSITGYPTWVQQTLQKAGYPITPVTQQALYLWAASEQPPSQWQQTNNYLDTEGDWGQSLSTRNLGYGPGNWNSVGVKMFSSQDAGTTATAQVLKNLPGVDAAFKNGKSLKAIFGAIQLSTFCCTQAPRGGPGNCGLCSGGQYPPKLYQALGLTAKQAAAYVQSLIGTSLDEGSPSAGVTGGTYTLGSGCSQLPGWDLKVTTISACTLKAAKGALITAGGVVVMAVGLYTVLKGATPKPTTIIGLLPGRSSQAEEPIPAWANRPGQAEAAARRAGQKPRSVTMDEVAEQDAKERAQSPTGRSYREEGFPGDTPAPAGSGLAAIPA